jgi:hypothetical protein
MMEDFPFLTGIDRARFQEHAWSVAVFSWAMSELNRVKHPETDALLREKLEEWTPYFKH